MKDWRVNDSIMLEMCQLTAIDSNCLSRHIGAVLMGEQGDLISLSYNGPPSCLPNCGERYKDDPFIIEEYKKRGIKGEDHNMVCPRQVLKYKTGTHLEMCPVIHAERGTLLQAAVRGNSTKHSTLYMDECVPCPHCLIEMISAKVSYLVISSFKCYDEKSRYIFDKSHLKVRLFNDNEWYDKLPLVKE